MITTYQIRIYPTEEQITHLNKQFGCNRFIWNKLLEYSQAFYQKTKQRANQELLHLQLMLLKQEYSWLYEVNAQPLQQMIRKLKFAYDACFIRRSGFPKFKSKHDNQYSIYPQHTKLDHRNNKILFIKLGWIDVIFHRPELHHMKLNSVTIIRNKIGQYFANLSLDDRKSNPEISLMGKSIGIDLGLKDTITTSDGLKIPNPKIISRHEKNLKRKQKQLARCQKASKRRSKARLLVAKIHLKISNARKDFNHKLSRKLVDDNQVIFFEDLKVKNMVRNRHLSKAISEIAWSQLVYFTAYKARKEGKFVSKIDPFYPSSRLCSVDGYINKDLKLSDRSWICPVCNTEHDRDVNAAMNIHTRGWALVNLGKMKLV